MSRYSKTRKAAANVAEEARAGILEGGEVQYVNPDDMDPCGECPKGKCDGCDGCRWVLDLGRLLRNEYPDLHDGNSTLYEVVNGTLEPRP